MVKNVVERINYCVNGSIRSIVIRFDGLYSIDRLRYLDGGKEFHTFTRNNLSEDEVVECLRNDRDFPFFSERISILIERL